MAEIIRRFQGLAYRCQKVAHIHGVDYYNDSKATNISALIAAVKSLMFQDRRLWLISGGQDKQAEFTAMDSIMPDITRLLLFGQSAEKMQSHIHVLTDKICKFDKMLSALDYAKQYAEPGDLILLAPGCASFDEFSDYQERGQIFNQRVYSYIRLPA